MAESMFDTSPPGSRKWKCFVCGVEHKTYEEFRAHILDKHEEGREYLACPDCEAPVRCMSMHYKAKHPSRIMPKGIQTRVTVWHDFKADGKKKKTKTPNFRKGDFISTKMNGESFPYKSGYECNIYEILEQDNEVASYYYEPFRVPYFFVGPNGNGKWHDYIPDLKVHFIDGRVEIWEIKPATQTSLPRNKAKWTAMNTYAESMGWSFTVVTEVGMEKLKTKIRRQSATQP
jgi:hypothetical protein